MNKYDKTIATVRERERERERATLYRTCRGKRLCPLRKKSE